MSYTLTNDEKIGVIEQHLKSLEFSIFNLQLNIIEENSLPKPDSANIQTLNSSLDETQKKKDALLAELQKINSGQ